MCIKYLEKDQEGSKYSVSVSGYYHYYYFTRTEGTEAHCTLLSTLWGIQMNTRHGDCPKQMRDLKWEIILYKYLLHGILSAHTPCSAGQKDPHDLSPHLLKAHLV